MSEPKRTTKAELRARMKAITSGMTDEQRHTASVQACARLIGLEAFEHANTVMLYMPMSHEVDVTPVAVQCFRLGKTVCVPKVDWKRREMNPVEVTSLDDDVLDCDEHGVRSPRDCRPIMLSLIDMVIVPGLAFDQQGHRLGRGGGYYDRFLVKLKSSVSTVGIAFDQQIVDSIPTKSHDRAVDIVTTDRRVTQAKAMRSKS